MLAIVGPFVLFFIAGRYFVDPWELPRENKGELLIPHIQLDTLALRDDSGEPYDGEDTAGLWTLMYVAGAECGKACKNGLYYQMRQVQQTLGENMERLRRVIVHTAPANPELRAFLEDNVAGTVEVDGGAGAGHGRTGGGYFRGQPGRPDLPALPHPREHGCHPGRGGEHPPGS